MTSLTKAVSSALALSFANLRGLASASPAASAAKADGDPGDDDDKRKRKDNESDGDYATRMKAMDDDDSDKKKDDDAKASASIATVRESAHAAGVLEGAAAERSRCAAIFASPAAAGNIELTAELAFNTDMTPEQASGVMAKSRSGNAQAASAVRAARNPAVGPGDASGASSVQAAAQRMDRAMQLANPQHKR